MINHIKVKQMYNFFEEYISGYNFIGEDGKSMKLLKYEHTMRVAKLCKEIGKTVFQKEEDIYLCEIIGLFHDIGRWKQYHIYKSFKDHTTDDHARMGIEILKENNVLDIFEEYEKQIIIDSIYDHNKMYITNITDERTLTFAKIIRDADRLDNYIVECEVYDSKDEGNKVRSVYEECEGISEEVYNSVKNRQLVDGKYRKNINDFKFSKLAWIFDMSFDKSFEMVKENQYVDKIFNNIKNPDQRMIELYGIIKEFLNER